MTRPTDETLLQYVDGKLTDQDRARVEAALEEDPRLRTMVDAMRESERLAKALFDRPMREPPPKGLVDSILNAPSNSCIVSFAAMKRFVPSRPPSWRMAAAASAALLFGAMAGYTVRDHGAPFVPSGLIALGEVEPRGTLGKLLEVAQSGVVTSGDVGMVQHRLTVVATFFDKQKRPCREVEVLAHATPAEHSLAAALACRTRSGTWQIEGAVRLATHEAPRSGSYEPSGRAEKDAVGGLLALLGAGKALSSDEERSLIARSWRAFE